MYPQFDPDSAQAWLGKFFNAGIQAAFRPEALVVIVLLVLAVGFLAFVVATMSPAPQAPAEEDGAAFIGASCAWVCPWPLKVRAMRSTRRTARRHHSLAPL